MRHIFLSGSALFLIAVSATPTLAQTSSDPKANTQTVIVTGTRTEGRTTFETLAPVDVVSGEAIDAVVSSDLNDVLARQIPSFNVQRLPAADGLAFVRPASLRSLSPDQTLVLINGKRRHRSALLGGRGAQAADLNQIPNLAIDRIEVLRDGASAQYGSDAIAGVINIILDEKPGFQLTGKIGQYYEGDGLERQIGGQAGFDLGGKGFLVVSAEYASGDATSRTRQRPDAITFQAANPTLKVPNPVQRWGQPETTTLRASFNAAYDIDDTKQLYAFGTLGEGEGVTDFNWRNPVGTSAYLKSALDPAYDLFKIYPTGFTPRFGQDDKDRSFVIGLRGDIFPTLSFDLSGSFGANSIDYFISETINASLGSRSPTSFRAGELIQDEINLNLDFVYAWDIGLATPVNLAFGIERREESYEIKAGEVGSYAVGPLAAAGLPSGSNGFPGYSPQQAGIFRQESVAAYVDADAQLTEAFTLGASVRHEDFSRFGNSTDFKVSGRYAITPDLAIRATASTGFRAPTPAQLFSERTSQGLNTVTLNLVTSGRFNPTGPVAQIINARAGGPIIKPLTPEESQNLSIGLAYRNDAGFTATVDVYQIQVDKRFSTLGNFTLTNAERAALTALGFPGGESITQVSFFQNQFDTETTGVDVVVAYRFDFLGGDTSLTGAYNYNKTKVTREDNPNVFSATSQVTFERGLPQHNASLTADHQRGKLNLNARVRYYGEWTDVDTRANILFQDFGAMILTDLSVSYAFTEYFTATIGAENAFDSYPDEAFNQANRGLIYSRNAPYDTDGGQYYLRLNSRF